jgi:ParB-like chromosome segregation protein Spo0J
MTDKHGTLIAGHARILAARKLGLTHLQVIVLDHLSEAQARALRLADNKIPESGSWDEDKLSAELAAIRPD